jgi:molybdate transport system substrate-binding protein
VKKIIIAVMTVLLVLTSFTGCSNGGGEQKSITAFCAAATKLPMEEAAQAFEQRTGIKVYLTFGGSGTIISQMKLSGTGDLYIPASSDFMIKAQAQGVVAPDDNGRILAYLVPVIAVQKGNPKNIKTLADLARPDVEMSIVNPTAGVIGLYAIELLEFNGLLDAVKEAGTCVVYAENVDKLASYIVLKQVDAVIGWDVLASWNPDTTDAVFLEPDEIPSIAYIPAAISTYVQDRESAQKFIDFLASADGQAIFHRNGYIVSESEAKKLAPEARIGGEYKLPEGFTTLVK